MLLASFPGDPNWRQGRAGNEAIILPTTLRTRIVQYTGKKKKLFAIDMSNSCECTGVNGQQLHAVYKKPYFYYTSYTII